jgi:Flp pilus assembly protein TadD
MSKAAYDWDWVAAEQEFRRAIQLNPNYPVAQQWHGLLLASLGRFPEAEAEVKRARQLDPISAIINMGVAEVYTWERPYDEALAEYRKVIELDPSFAGAFGNLAYVYGQKHMYAEALKALKQKATLMGEGESARALDRVYERSGYPAVIREELKSELRRHSAGHYVNPTGVAGLYAAVGDNSHAFEWLQKAYEEHSSGMQFLAVSSDFGSIKSSPQYQYWLGILALPVIP